MGGNTSSLSQYVENSSLTTRMTNIMTSTSNTSTNVVTLANNLTFTVGGPLCGGQPTNVHCGSFRVNQSNNAKVQIVTEINSETSIALKNLISNDLQAKSSQTNKLIQGFLAGIGQFNNQRLSNTIINRIQTIINTNITQTTVNQILNKLSLTNNNTVTLCGEVTSDDCSQIQTNIADFAARNILKSLTNVIANDTVLNRAVADATQSNSVEQKGIDSIFGGFFLIIVALIAGVAVFGKEGVKAVTNWKFLAAVIALVVAWLGVSAILHKGPFAPSAGDGKTSYVCQTEGTGLNTGVCLEVDSKQKADAISKGIKVMDECVSGSQVDGGPKVSCPQYWGCQIDTNGFPTGVVIRGTSIQDAAGVPYPYATQTEAVKACNRFAVLCARDQGIDSSTGKMNETVSCQRINVPAPGGALDGSTDVHIGSNLNAATNECNATCHATQY